ncbi:sulfatase-like hydrolase/transferase [Verrucomicrobia bacterium]|nr:sulfatase-like hydrolase/transferase [Verrucomicrobiota bacterium]
MTLKTKTFHRENRFASQQVLKPFQEGSKMLSPSHVIQRLYKRLASLLSAISIAGLITSTTSTLAGQPNILLILADDLGYGDVSCYNDQSKVLTPHIDQLAKQGLRFTDAHSPSTVCTPTRYSIMTGRMAFRNGTPGVFTGVGGPCLIEESRLTLPGMLNRQGYKTALIGKWHIGMTFFDSAGVPIHQNGLEAVKKVDYSQSISDGPIHRGFEHFFGTVCCPTTDWLYAFVHGDRIPIPPTHIVDRGPLPKHPYSRDNRPGIIAPDFDLEEVDMLFLKKSVAFLEEHVAKRPDQPFFLFHSTQAVHLPSFPGKDFKGKTKVGPHGDFIHELDYLVGELIQTLDRLQLAEDTLVILTSDNGPETITTINMRRDHQHDGARPWRGMKRDNWEGGHRVPLIVRWPGNIKPNTITDSTVCLTDIMATCAEITDYSLPNEAAEDSLSFKELFDSPKKPIRDYTLHQTIKLELAIRRGPWKYLDHQGSGGNNYNREHLKPFILPEKLPDAPGQLYHLGQDPGERNNLYNQHPKIVREFQDKLAEYRKTGRSVPSR